MKSHVIAVLLCCLIVLRGVASQDEKQLLGKKGKKIKRKKIHSTGNTNADGKTSGTCQSGHECNSGLCYGGFCCSSRNKLFRISFIIVVNCSIVMFTGLDLDRALLG